jgi:hypothetical protein
VIYDAACEDDLDLIGRQTVLRLYCDDSERAASAACATGVT